MTDLKTAKQYRFLLHIVILLAGIISVAVAFLVSKDGDYAGLVKTILLSLGTTVIVSSLVAILYQKYGLSELHQIEQEIRQRLTVHQDATEAGILAVYRNRRSINRAEWTRFIEKARRVVWLYGMAEAGYADDDEVREILCNLVEMGGKVRILLLNPTSHVSREIDQEEGGSGDGLPGRISKARDQFVRIRNNNQLTKEHVEIRTYDCYPQVSIVRSDDQMLVTPYLRYLPGDTCPTFCV